MSQSKIEHCRIAGVATCVPAQVVDNLEVATDFPAAEVRKIVQMAGIRKRKPNLSV
jgi:3-oxoacyl-[acyl-carrier-protein] synthase III